MSANPFGLLEESMPSETVESPVFVVAPATVVVAESKPAAEQAAPRWKRPTNNSHSESPKSTPVKASLTSEHAPSRLIYSREWLLAVHKNYAAPSGFNSASAAFHDASQLPVALLPVSHDVRPHFSALLVAFYRFLFELQHSTRS